MLYLLYEWLKDGEAGRYFNFLRYPSFRIVAAGVAVAGARACCSGPRLIERLRVAQHGQSNVREDTPETHQKKKGTPTMGGALILLCIVAGHAALRRPAHRAWCWVALLMTLGYGFIGFLDDWLKLSKRNSKGLAGPLQARAADRRSSWSASSASSPTGRGGDAAPARSTPR